MSSVDDYLKKLDAPQKDELERIRDIVRETVPEAKEVISYGMPVFKYKNKYLVGYASFKNHMSLFPGSGPVEALKHKLEGYTLSKGTIQFTAQHNLPKALIKEILKRRLDDINKTSH